jgi:pilus assembly protein CpaE
MQAFIVSDQEAISLKIRQILLREGHDCEAAHVVALDRALDHLVQFQPQLIALAISPHADSGLDVLSQVRHLQGSARVIAVGPANDPKLILRALHNGADDFVDEADLESELGKAVMRIATDVPAQAKPGRLLTLLAPSGGSGSSTLAVNMAAVLAREHQRALLFDLKLETGDLAALLNLKPAHTLADLCQHAARMDRTMFERSVTRHASGVHLLAPPKAFSDIDVVTPEGVRQALMLGRTLFPYVVVDLDHSYREVQEHALRLADVVLVLLRLDFTCLRHTKRTLEYLAGLGIGSERVRVVVNRYGQPKEVPAARAEEALGIKIDHYVPEDQKTINRANNNGIPVVLESPSSKVAKSVMRLAMSVNGQHPARESNTGVRR